MRAELLIRKRIWKLMVVLTALFGAIVARIISLTVIQGETLTARGVRQWTQEGKVEARRGSIVDRNGETLALSTTAYIRIRKSPQGNRGRGLRRAHGRAAGC